MARSAKETFDVLRTLQYEPSLRGIRGTYLFEIENVGRWFMSVDQGAITFGDQPHEADCTIRCAEEDFVDIIEGRRNLVTAVLQSRVQVRGDIALAQKFHGFVGATIERKRGVA